MAKTSKFASEAQFDKHVRQSAVLAHNGSTVFYRKSDFISVSVGSADAGKPVKLGLDGLLDSTLCVSGVVISGTPVQYDYARFTDADTIEGRSYSEMATDLGLNQSNWDSAYSHSQIAGGDSVHVSITENTNWDAAYSHIHNLTTDINHDALTNFTTTEHFTMANITVIGSGTGVVYTTSGTVSLKTIGIANTNILTVNHVSPADNDYAKFTASGIEGRNYSEVRSDLGLVIGTNVLAQQSIGIANDYLVEMDDTDAADNDYAKFTANGLEGRSYAEVLSDLSGTATSAFGFNNQNLNYVGNIGIGCVPGATDVLKIASSLNQVAISLYTSYSGGGDIKYVVQDANYQWNMGLNIYGVGAGKWSLFYGTGLVHAIIASSTQQIWFPGVYNDDIGEERPLLIQADGQIGYDGSSIRFKTNIQDMEDTSWLYDLRPVNFEFKKNPGKKCYGMIAEELAEICPELVFYGDDGQVDAINKKGLIFPMLNEMKKLRERIEVLEGEVHGIN